MTIEKNYVGQNKMYKNRLKYVIEQNKIFDYRLDNLTF
jgi:hypothetical protein